MRKILEIEGLLYRLQHELTPSGLLLASDSIISAINISYYPVNSYSGLNSLRNRLSTTTSEQSDNDELSTSETDSLINGENLSANHPTKEIKPNNRGSSNTFLFPYIYVNLNR